MTEAARAPNAKEVSELIGSHITAFLDGGPDREAEDVELGQAVGLKVERISGRWNDARDYLLQTPPAPREPLKAAPLTGVEKVESLTALQEAVKAKDAGVDSANVWQRRPLPPEPAEERPALLEKLKSKEAKEPLFISPSIQPEVVEQPRPQPNDQSLAGAEPIKEEPKRKEDEPGPKSKSGVIIDMGAPYEVARRFLLDRYSLDGVTTLRWWNAEWRKWTGTHYAATEEDALRAEIYQFLAMANYGKFDPASKHVNAVVDAIKAWVLLSADAEVGAWLGDGSAPWGAEPIICCKNGVLRLSDGRLWPHDPRLFALNVIETEYRSEAKAPRWERFLEELWNEDHATRNALQEFFGLVLTDETKFQKGFILVGPARSGKGTISRVLMHLLGRSNFCGPSLGQLAQVFGMQGLIGKKIAVVPDARLDQRANRSVITEKLLSIIGEDVQDINRKNKPYWSGILRLRLMILSNELPDFKDDTGVIATRFVILQTQVSFLGREDTELEAKLCAELSGILNWALIGWQRLAQRRKFAPPGEGELNEELASNASAVKAFVAECCELGPDFTVSIEMAYNRYRTWCEGNGARTWADRLPINQFSGKLRSAFHGQVQTIRPRDGGTRKRLFSGLRLRKERSA